MRIHYIFFLIVVFGLNAKSQTTDTLAVSSSLLKQSIVPVTLITIGSIANYSNFEKDLQTNLRNKVGNDFQFYIENYLQYAPIAELYLADALKIKAKNHWFDQTKYLIISNVITSGITHSIKSILNKTRPNGASYSFPSGHTSFSFTNASVLRQEFKQTAPLLSYSGYLFSGTTGTFRMINNKHWFSDVIVGAGIGILVTELVYYFEPLKSFNPFLNSKNSTLIPQINQFGYGMYFAHCF